MTQKRIAILTGGGDVPGLNSVIKSVVYRATEMGYEAIGVRRGWEGLTHLTVGSDEDRTTSATSIGPTRARSIGPAGPSSTPRARTPQDAPGRDARRHRPFALAVDGGRGGSST